MTHGKEWNGRDRPEHDVKRLPVVQVLSLRSIDLCGDEVGVQLTLQNYVSAS